MGNVYTALSMSLDGFIAGPGDTVQEKIQDLFAWYGAGDTEYQMPSGRMPLRVAREDAEVLRAMHAATGALVAVGSGCGLLLTLLVARGLRSLLFGAGALDPLVFLAAPLLFLAVGALAAYLPARRAARVSPVEVLNAG